MLLKVIGGNFKIICKSAKYLLKLQNAFIGNWWQQQNAFIGNWWWQLQNGFIGNW
jgi:hypothetical protein